MTSKVCYKCKREKKIESFYKDKRYKDGHTSYCKICQRDAVKKSIDKKNQSQLSKQSGLRLTNVSLDDYCEMWRILEMIGYNLEGDIHHQFCEKFDLPPKKKNKKSLNRFTLDECK